MAATFGLDAAIARAREAVPGPALDFVATLVSGRVPGDEAALILQRFQQLTGAVAAKAVEDTAFYRHLPLVSLNEVGGAPERFGIEPDDFHAVFARRRQLSPDALSSLSTHDHKRGADVRARLAALTELAPEWQSGLVAWSALLAPQSRRQRRPPGAEPPARAPVLPDRARHLARRRPGQGLCRPHRRLSAEGGARGQGRDQLDRPGPGL